MNMLAIRMALPLENPARAVAGSRQPVRTMTIMLMREMTVMDT